MSPRSTRTSTAARPRLLACLTATTLGLALVPTALTASAAPATASGTVVVGAWDPMDAGVTDSGSGGILGIAGDEDTVYVTGLFNEVSGLVTNDYLARYAIESQSWMEFPSGPSAPPTGIALDGQGDLVVYGEFSSVGGVANTQLIARWDGTTWQAFGDAADTLDGAVRDVAVTPNGDLYAAGDFTAAGTTTLNYIAKWNGTDWVELGGGLGGPVYAVTSDSQGNLYAVGDFTATGNLTPAARIAKWNGTAWSALGAGLEIERSSSVFDLEVDSQDRLYVGGQIVSAGSQEAIGAAMWDGTTWSALAGGVSGGTIHSIAIDSADQVYVGGDFTAALEVGGQTEVEGTAYFARWDGVQWQGTDSPPDAMISSLAEAGTGGAIFAGGTFESAGGTTLNELGMFRPAPTLVSVSPERLTIGGGAVTLRGAALTGWNVDGTDLAVTFDGNPGTALTRTSESELTVTAPALRAGEKLIEVTNAVGSSGLVIEYVSAPTAPQRLRVSARGDGSLTLAWDASSSPGSGPITSYSVRYRKTATGPWIRLASSSVRGRTATITGLRDNAETRIEVKANADLTGPAATLTARTAAPPKAPTKVRASVARGKVKVTWTKAVITAVSSLTRNVVTLSKGATRKKVTTTAGATSATISVGRGTWTVTVTAYTQAGAGPASAKATVSVG